MNLALTTSLVCSLAMALATVIEEIKLKKQRKIRRKRPSRRLRKTAANRICEYKIDNWSQLESILEIRLEI